MCHKPFKYKNSRAPFQRGFSLVSAIFLLVILSALGVFMLSISTMQHTTSAQDLQGSKAYQAAKAGIEWGVYQIMTPENSIAPLAVVTPYACPATTPLPALGGALAGFTVTVGCQPLSTFVEGGNTVRVYRLTSMASMGVPTKTSYIERSMSASVNTCRVGPAATDRPC
jgi:MSHA biogenesis protein MshP